ncbi:hypothetical protein DIPPA_30654 [Diplonema papillatum]|nr:hypothetical protein DIPPA_30654 [Diplonema papillatum]
MLRGNRRERRLVPPPSLPQKRRAASSDGAGDGSTSDSSGGGGGGGGGGPACSGRRRANPHAWRPQARGGREARRWQPPQSIGGAPAPPPPPPPYSAAVGFGMRRMLLVNAPQDHQPGLLGRGLPSALVNPFSHDPAAAGGPDPRYDAVDYPYVAEWNAATATPSAAPAPPPPPPPAEEPKVWVDDWDEVQADPREAAPSEGSEDRQGTGAWPAANGRAAAGPAVQRVSKEHQRAIFGAHINGWHADDDEPCARPAESSRRSCANSFHDEAPSESRPRAFNAAAAAPPPPAPRHWGNGPPPAKQRGILRKRPNEAGQPPSAQHLSVEDVHQLPCETEAYPPAGLVLQQATPQGMQNGPKNCGLERDFLVEGDPLTSSQDSVGMPQSAGGSRLRPALAKAHPLQMPARRRTPPVDVPKALPRVQLLTPPKRGPDSPVLRYAPPADRILSLADHAGMFGVYESQEDLSPYIPTAGPVVVSGNGEASADEGDFAVSGSECVFDPAAEYDEQAVNQFWTASLGALSSDEDNNIANAADNNNHGPSAGDEDALFACTPRCDSSERADVRSPLRGLTGRDGLPLVVVDDSESDVEKRKSDTGPVLVQQISRLKRAKLRREAVIANNSAAKPDASNPSPVASTRTACLEEEPAATARPADKSAATTQAFVRTSDTQIDAPLPPLPPALEIKQVPHHAHPPTPNNNNNNNSRWLLLDQAATPPRLRSEPAAPTRPGHLTKAALAPLDEQQPTAAQRIMEYLRAVAAFKPGSKLPADKVKEQRQRVAVEALFLQFVKEEFTRADGCYVAMVQIEEEVKRFVAREQARLAGRRDIKLHRFSPETATHDASSMLTYIKRYLTCIHPYAVQSTSRTVGLSVSDLGLFSWSPHQGSSMLQTLFSHYFKFKPDLEARKVFKGIKWTRGEGVQPLDMLPYLPGGSPVGFDFGVWAPKEEGLVHKLRLFEYRGATVAKRKLPEEFDQETNGIENGNGNGSAAAVGTAGSVSKGTELNPSRLPGCGEDGDEVQFMLQAAVKYPVTSGFAMLKRYGPETVTGMVNEVDALVYGRESNLLVEQELREYLMRDIIFVLHPGLPAALDVPPRPIAVLVSQTRRGVGRSTRLSYIHYIGVVPEYQGQGIGKHLLNLLSAGDTPCLLEVHDSNENAARLYASFGYHRVGFSRTDGHWDYMFRPSQAQLLAQRLKRGAAQLPGSSSPTATGAEADEPRVVPACVAAALAVAFFSARQRPLFSKRELNAVYPYLFRLDLSVEPVKGD